MPQGWRHLDEIVWKMGLKITSLNVSNNKLKDLPEQIGDLILLKVRRRRGPLLAVVLAWAYAVDSILQQPFEALNTIVAVLL